MKKVFQNLISIIKYFFISIGAYMVLSNTICGFGQKSVIIPYTRTKFSDNFSKDIFWNNIAREQSKKDVIEYLGQPFEIDTLSQDCMNIKYKHYYQMIYSKEYKNMPFNFAWCMFSVYLDDNFKVVNKEEVWSNDKHR